MSSTPYVVSDVMTRAPVAVGRDAPFKDVVRLMEQWKVSALPVLEGEGRVIGVVSEADLLPKEEFRNRDLDRYTQLHRLSDLAKADALTAEELMTSPVVTVHPDSTLAQAARIMAQRKIKRIPVVNGEGLLEGIVSRADLLKVFLRPDKEIADEIQGDIVDVLFPAPLEPIHTMVGDGVVTLTGKIEDARQIPLTVRLVQAVEGVVDVDCRLRGADAG
ncbi:CBS domain-containing protein [Streptomyces chiangmaiensis]|uniref:CBS domain-containing protein n=1 Tax=Streptomyces chiangmaiensis TaxID=766497 RepID=A0ABU7FQJ2_9ACTN|nr:CBS domain-containing protein [Streptomyces chiangmaiensis]MED7826319.1 CBS domain-containing protein [Streptomyces chiangmaiensis]